jgi:hypothetical protein
MSKYPASGHYFEFARGEWAKDGNGVVTKYPTSGVVYTGSLTREQRDELDKIINDYLRSLPEV